MSKNGHFWGVLDMIFGVNFGVKNEVKKWSFLGSRKNRVIFGVFGDLQILGVLGQFWPQERSGSGFSIGWIALGYQIYHFGAELV